MLILPLRDSLTFVGALHDKNILRKSHKSNSRKLIPKSPWITMSLCKSIYRINKLYQRYISHPTECNRSKYVHDKNILTNIIHKFKQNYNAKQFDKAKGTCNIKGTWKVINSVLHNEPRYEISSMNIDGHSIDNSYNYYCQTLIHTLQILLVDSLTSTILPSSVNFGSFL